ncbi:MAG TPA: hypothetical protein VGL81_10170 [Polyangiaceae bacterium]|jgi:hypothetical protein
MKTALFLLLCAAATLLRSAPAMADDRAACLDASMKGQTFRDAQKLIEAREQFRVCAQARCPAVVQTDCASWLDSVEKSLPTVVITAKDGTGTPLFDVKVTVDGAPLTTSLDGRAVPMNPGAHKFHFELADGTSRDVEDVVTEGTQNQSVTAVLARPVAGPPPAPQPPPTPLPATPPPTSPAEGSSAWKTVGWVVGGVGAAGLVVGSIFGVVAMSDKSNAHCSDNLCDSGPLASAKSAAKVSDVGLIAGGVLFAGGGALVLFAPGSGHGQVGLTVAPLVGANDGGVVVGGHW